MDKKTIKAVLDIIKDVNDRPGLYGMEINGRYIIFTDGYVVVRLEMGTYEGLRPFPMADHVWVSGEQLKEKHKEMGARDVLLSVRDDDHDNKQLNEPKVLHPNWGELWKQWNDAEQVKSATAIRPETFKKLAPFGDMIMSITENKMGQRLIKFEGKGVVAFACPLKG